MNDRNNKDKNIGQKIPKTKKLELKNIGPFKGNHEYEFEENVNIIIGQAGTGKTTFVKSLKSAYCCDPLPSENWESSSDEESLIKVYPWGGNIKTSAKFEENEINRDGNQKSQKKGLSDKQIFRFLKGSSDLTAEDILKNYSFSERKELRIGLSTGDRIFLDIILQSAITCSTESYLIDEGVGKSNLDFGYLDEELRIRTLNFLLNRDFQTILTTPLDLVIKEDVDIDNINLIYLDDNIS